MKYAIEAEEIIKMHHQIIVEVDENNADELLEKAINGTEHCNDIDDFVNAIRKVLPVVQINEDFDGESERIDYYDDYKYEL